MSFNNSSVMQHSTICVYKCSIHKLNIKYTIRYFRCTKTNTNEKKHIFFKLNLNNDDSGMYFWEYFLSLKKKTAIYCTNGTVYGKVS